MTLRVPQIAALAMPASHGGMSVMHRPAATPRPRAECGCSFPIRTPDLREIRAKKNGPDPSVRPVDETVLPQLEARNNCRDCRSALFRVYGLVAPATGVKAWPRAGLDCRVPVNVMITLPAESAPADSVGG